MVFQTLKFAVIFIVVMIIYLFIKRPEHFRWRDFLSCVWWVYVITLLLMVFQSDQPIGELPVSFRERIAYGLISGSDGRNLERMVRRRKGFLCPDDQH